MWLVVRETCDRLRDISPDFAGDGMVRMRHRCGNRRERAFRDDDRGHQAGCRTPAQAFGAHRHQQKPRADHYDQSGALRCDHRESEQHEAYGDRRVGEHAPAGQARFDENHGEWHEEYGVQRVLTHGGDAAKHHITCGAVDEPDQGQPSRNAEFARIAQYERAAGGEQYGLDQGGDALPDERGAEQFAQIPERAEDQGVEERVLRVIAVQSGGLQVLGEGVVAQCSGPGEREPYRPAGQDDEQVWQESGA